jgi:hypothetical protein
MQKNTLSVGLLITYKMKEISLFIFFILLAFSLSAQELEIPGKNLMKPKLEGQEINKLADADNLLSKALSQQAEFEKQDKLATEVFSKKKKKKAEKKSVNAKKAKITSAQSLQKAYMAYYDLFLAKIGSVAFIYPNDEAEAKKSLKASEEDCSDAKTKLSRYSRLKDSELAKTDYQRVKSDLDDMATQFNSAMENMEIAIGIWAGQEEKKKAEELDDEDWKVAMQQNTMASYQTYATNNPNGKYITDANQKIANLEEKKRIEEASLKEDVKASSGLIYQVQIFATKKQVGEEKLKKLTKGEKAEEVFDNEYYKYTIGEFKKYNDAQAQKSKIRKKGAFIVPIFNGKRIEIVEALKIENGK